MDALTLDDLVVVQRKMWDARMKWFNIGLELSMSATDLEAIGSDCRDEVDKCFRKVLQHWLSNSAKLERTWPTLISALKSKTVGFGEVADEIELNILFAKKPSSGSVDHRMLDCDTHHDCHSLKGDLASLRKPKFRGESRRIRWIG